LSELREGGEAMKSKWDYFFLGMFFGSFIAVTIRTVMGA